MVRMTCLKCGDPLPVQDGPGRPRTYCSEGCRRAAEYELRRLERRITNVEGSVTFWRRRVDGVDYFGGDPKVAEKHLSWWRDELERLEGRLAEILDGKPATPSKGD